MLHRNTSVPSQKKKITLTAPAAIAPMIAGKALNYGILDTLLGYALRRAQNGVYLHFFASASDPEVTPQRFAALVLIEKNPDISQTTLAEAMGINRSGAMRLVDWLQGRALAERVSDSSDARRWGIRLTTQGRKTLAAMTDAVRAHEAHMATLLGDDFRTLKTLLDRLADATNSGVSNVDDAEAN